MEKQIKLTAREMEMGTVAIRNLKKRQAILEAAYQLFRANGFERTSISAIVAVVGGSKGTIYAHFGSKENLFVDCMFSVPEYSMARMLEDLHAEGKDLEAQLREFGESFLRLACTPDVVSVRRLMISEAQRGGVGRMFYERFKTFQQALASFISTCMTHGRLHLADAHIAATQLRLLLEAEVIDPLLLCAIDGPIADIDVRRMSDRAIDTFLRAYAPNGVQANEPALQARRLTSRPVADADADAHPARVYATCPMGNEPTLERIRSESVP